MSTFLIPTSLEEELKRMMNSFWWGSNKITGKGIKWLRWEKLTVRNGFGGLGFCSLHGFNLAMDWRFMTDQDDIVSRVFKVKYLSKTEFLGAHLGHNPSYVWRNIYFYFSHVVVKAGFGGRCVMDHKSTFGETSL